MKDPKAAATGGGDADLVKNGGVLPLEEMTSKDYYFDSYAHFGIHEVGCALGPGKQGNKNHICNPGSNTGEICGSNKLVIKILPLVKRNSASCGVNRMHDVMTTGVLA